VSRRDPLEGVQPAPPPEPFVDQVRRRQRQRALIMALLLGAFVILVYAISIVRMGMGE
jgi:hypothetical protein